MGPEGPDGGPLWGRGIRPTHTYLAQRPGQGQEEKCLVAHVSAHGLSHINPEGASEGVRSLLLRVCKSGAGCCALGRKRDPAWGQGRAWWDSASRTALKNSVVAPESVLTRMKLWGPEELPPQHTYTECPKLYDLGGPGPKFARAWALPFCQPPLSLC